METIEAKDLVEKLHRALPEFEPQIEEHLSVYDEVLLHVLFGDLTRFIEEAWAKKEVDVVERALRFLNDALVRGNEEVNNVVAVSFIENVGPWAPAKKDFIATWPAELHAEAQRQRDWRPNSR